MKSHRALMGIKVLSMLAALLLSASTSTFAADHATMSPDVIKVAVAPPPVGGGCIGDDGDDDDDDDCEVEDLS